MTSRLPDFAKALLATLTIALLGVLPAVAQPQTIPYQGFLTNEEGQPAGGQVNLDFSLYTTADGNQAPLWQETHLDVPVNGGVFSVMLGSSEPFDAVPFDQTLYLGVSVDGGAELSPRVTLGATPASMFAQESTLAHDVSDEAAVKSLNGMRGDIDFVAGNNVTIEGDEGGGGLVFSADVGVRSLNGLVDDVVLEAGENVTVTAGDGVLTIDAEAGEPFSLPFEATNETNLVGLRINSSVASAIAVSSTGGAPALVASSSGTNDAIEIANTSGASEQGAIEARSFSRGYTGRFDHFGQEGYAGIFSSTQSGNEYPALVVRKSTLEVVPEELVNDALLVSGTTPVVGIYGAFDVDSNPGVVLGGLNEDGTVGHKWAMIREFFGLNRLQFTSGLDNDPKQNAVILSLDADGAEAPRFVADRALGENGIPPCRRSLC